MLKRTNFFGLLFCFCLGTMFTTYGQEDSTFIRSCFNTALSEGKSYSDLRELCKKVGARLSGSVEAEMAVEWAFQKLNTYGFDRVYKQEIMVPHWERGTKEAAWIKTNTGELIPMKILALGGSVGTQGSLRGELIVFKHLDELIKAKPKQIQDKIVLIDQKMNEQELVTFHAYGGCYQIRRNGAVEAAKLGAKAVLIRSLALPTDDHPHTGSMHYDDKVTKIPAAALSTRDCELIASQKGKIEFIFEMDCRVYPDAPSHNVIAEIKGSSNADQIITFGGHLDSWDAGEGAHDDGAGVVHCIEALRILKELGYRPKHTLRLVLFMNEENGNFGGKSYAKWVHEQGEKHAAALESDRGGFVPRGFACDGDTKYVQLIQSFSELLKPYGLHDFGPGYGGVDISPLKNEYPGIPLFGFVPDSQRYFDFHHAESDVFEAVNQRELELGCASMAAFLYLLDKNL